MKKLFVLFSLLFTQFLFAQYTAQSYLQTKGEVYFKFAINDLNELKNITSVISIDDVKGKDVYAYANQKGYDTFLKYGYNIEVLKHPGDVGKVDMSSNFIEAAKGWNTYPTYDAYLQMMYAFQENYGSLCQIVDAGTTVSGRKILFAKLSKNVTQKEAEPKFMYSSSIHGDETTGYVLMLRLIDSLLSTYNSNARIKNLLDNCEIWINPLANPDGTYKSGNSTVNGAVRYNSNYVDINRNFPDPADGPHPDGEVWQPETIIMMNLATNNYFSMSANFHGGTEVANYPWDTWVRRHTDDAWFQYISREYADTCHKVSTSYMSGYVNGITNGYDWYRVAGGRQDYFTFFKKGREITFEISNTKLVAASTLPTYWNYNKRSLLNYMEQSLYGIKGIVTDSTTGAKVSAKIEILSHDLNADSSFTYSDSETGFYSRLIAAGTYSVKISANKYFPKTITGVTVANRSTKLLNVQLVPTDPIPVELTSFTAKTTDNGTNLNWSTATETNNKGFEIYKKSRNQDWQKIGFVSGNGTTTELNNYSYFDNLNTNGTYNYKLKQIDFDGSYNFSQSCEVSFTANYDYKLFANYPNPFNPSTVISFSLPVESKVTITLYNLIGQKVKDITNQVYQSGRHEINFNAESLSAGVYIYKLNADGNNNTHFTASNKMILVK